MSDSGAEVGIETVDGVPEEITVGLPGIEPILAPIPILKSQNDGPISRLLKTVVDETPTPTEPRPTSTLESGDIDKEEEVADDRPLIEPIKLTIRELKFKDPLENAPLGDTPPVGSSTHQPATELHSHTNDSKSSSSGRNNDDHVELNLAGDDTTTNVQVDCVSPQGDDDGSAVVVDTTAAEQQHEEEARDAKVVEVSGDAEETAVAITTLTSTPSTDRIPATDGSESGCDGAQRSSASPAVSPLDEGGRRSNNDDLVQQVAAISSCAVDDNINDKEDITIATIDGLLLLNEVDRSHEDHHHHDELQPLNLTEHGDGEVQQAFEVEIVEENSDDRKSIDAIENSDRSSAATVVDRDSTLNTSSAATVPLNTHERCAEPTTANPATNTTESDPVVADAASETCGDISDAVVVVIPSNDQIIGQSVDVEDSVKIRPRCDDWVTRIASYYSQTTEDEDGDEQEKKKPSVPPKTYQWEDIRRSKQLGGYPWTHLYKPPLGPEDEPELLQRIRTLPKQRKRFEQKLIDTGSPKSQKRVRIDTEVLVQVTEKYIQSLDDNNNITDDLEFHEKEIPDPREEVEEQETTPSVSEFFPEEAPKSPLTRKKSFRKGLRKLNPGRLLKRSSKANVNEESATPKETEQDAPVAKPRTGILCHPIVVKLRELAKRQIKRSPSKSVKRTHLSPTDMEEKQKILNLRESPKAGGREISSFIERQESDDAVEIVQLEESPGEVKRRKGQETPTSTLARPSSYVEPDEILILPEKTTAQQEPNQSDVEPTISEILEEELRHDYPAPKKMARRQKEHYYEDIDPVDDDPNEHLNFTLMTPEMMHPAPPSIDLSLIGASGETMKTSLANQDNQLMSELALREKRLSDLMTQSSGEEDDQALHHMEAEAVSSHRGFLLAPISSIDSASSEDERKVPLTPVIEESDRESISAVVVQPVTSELEMKSPDEEEEEQKDRKEDIELTLPTKSVRIADDPAADDDNAATRESEAHALVSSVLSTAVQVVHDRWKGMSDHEYEPIGPPIDDHSRHSPSPITEQTRLSLSPPKVPDDEEEISIQDIQDEIENRYFALTPTTTGSRTDCEINTSCVDSSAIEDLPLDRASRRRWNVGERSKQMQQRFKTGADKLKTRFRSKSSEPKPDAEDTVEAVEAVPKDKKRFKGPEFSKLKNMNLFHKKQTTTTDESPARPTILVSDTTIEIDHKPAPKPSFASKFKSPDFSKFKGKFTKSEPVTPAEDHEEHEENVKPKPTSIFKKFEFKKASDTPKPVEVTVVEEETQKMDTIQTPHENEGRESNSPITPEPPITPDCYEAGVSDMDKENVPVKSTSRFKAPDLSKIKDFKRPQFTKFEFHRPKFNKPDMSRFKIPQRFHSLKLKRTKSMKETSGTASTTDSEPPVNEFKMEEQPKKKPFEFGTYPRIFSKMRKGSGGATAKAGRAATPEPPVIFTTTATSEGTTDTEYRAELDTESGSYQKYAADGDEYFDRETSVERRMREHFTKARDVDSVDGVGIMRETDEQKQLHSFNEENRAIHEISHARRDEFQLRKPFIHQDSDLVSEDSTGKWGQQVDDEKLAEQAMINRLLQHDIELQKQNDLDRRSIPQSNKDTISSGSASDRQRTNVIEEIDDDEFFLRSKGISQDNIRIGEYISSAIREGLTSPTVNSLKQVGGGDDDYRYYGEDEPRNYGYDVAPPPRRPRRGKDSVERNRSGHNAEDEDEMEDYELGTDFESPLKATEDDGYFTVGPHRPTRTKSLHRNDRYDSSELNADQRSYYDNESEIIMMDEEGSVGPTGFSRMPPPTPPKVPKRKKKMANQMSKRIEKMDGFTGRSVSNSALVSPPSDFNGEADNIVVYRTEFEIPPIATPEKFTPVPTPRRTRSRSQLSRFTDDDRTSRGAESLVSDAHDHHQQKNVLDLNKNGYAVIKKEPPPRPPAPLRRKRSTKSLGNDRQFNTMPHLQRKAASPPPRPSRNYSTIVPSRPPRTKSVSSLGEAARPTKSSPDVTEYEEIGATRDLQSGAVVNKMKDRPLPPPPRPERTLPRRKKDQPKEPSVGQDEPSDDRDGGGERIVAVDAADVEQSPPPTIDQQLSIEEMDISTQTEPLPDDYVCEEVLDISSDMKTIIPTQSKTLEDILKEEQEAEFERAQQQVAETNLSRGLQRFRDANQRSLSEKSWASRDRPKTPSSIQPSPHSSALRMNIESFMEAERREEVLPRDLSEEPQDLNSPTVEETANELNRHIMEDSAKDNVDKILNVDVDESQPDHVPDSTIRSQAEEIFKNVESEIERQAARLENIIDRLSEGTPPPQTSPMHPYVTDLPPVAPPRRKSSIEDPRLMSAVNDLSSRTQLDVDRLNVNQLTAQDIHSNSITTNEIRTSEITKISQELIDQITERILNSEQLQNRTNPQPPPPPPPSGFFAIPSEYLNSVPPASFYQLRDPDEKQTSTAEEEKRARDKEDPKEGSSTSEDPSVLRLGGEFLSACGSSIKRNVRELMNLIPSSLLKVGEEEGATSTNRRDINVILLILIIIICCLMAFAMGGSRTVHHHHWDFFNPPGSESLD